MQQKTLVQLAIVGALVVVAGAWLYFSDASKVERTMSADEAVARVNGENVTRADLDTIKKQLTFGLNESDVASMDEEGRAEIETQALDRLVTQALLRQAAEQSGVSASEENVQVEMDAIRAQFESEEEYQVAVSGQGYTEDTLRLQIASDLMAQAYLEQELGLTSITATDEEIQTEYDLAAAEDAELAELSEVRDQIETFLVQQKQQQLVSAHIEELRAQADVEILL
jgi:hypothetical protein